MAMRTHIEFDKEEYQYFTKDQMNQIPWRRIPDNDILSGSTGS